MFKQQTYDTCDTYGTNGFRLIAIYDMIWYDLFANKTQIHPETYKKNTPSRCDKAEKQHLQPPLKNKTYDASTENN